MFEILYDFLKNGLQSEAFNDLDPPVSNLSAEQSHHKPHMIIIFEIVKLVSFEIKHTAPVSSDCFAIRLISFWFCLSNIVVPIV